MKQKSSFAKKVLQIVAQIPPGRTLTYKEVAILAGNPRAYRAVGNILHHNKNWPRIPCHRVIRSDGKVGGWRWGKQKKILLLKKEGFLRKNALKNN